MSSQRVRYRLERGQWIGRERDSAGRRGVLISALRDRSAEMLGLYAGMSKSVDRICADCTDTELDLIAGFLSRAADVPGAPLRAACPADWQRQGRPGAARLQVPLHLKARSRAPASGRAARAWLGSGAGPMAWVPAGTTA